MKDSELTWIFQERLTSHNGFRCGRQLSDNGVRGTEYTCEGRTTIVNGRLKYDGTCGEPCSFICEDASALQHDIDHVIDVAKIIDEAKNQKEK